MLVPSKTDLIFVHSEKLRSWKVGYVVVLPCVAIHSQVGTSAESRVIKICCKDLKSDPKTRERDNLYNMSLTSRYGCFSPTIPGRGVVMGFSGPTKSLSRSQARRCERMGQQLSFHREGPRRWQASSNDMASNESEFDLSQCVLDSPWI